MGPRTGNCLDEANWRVGVCKPLQVYGAKMSSEKCAIQLRLDIMELGLGETWSASVANAAHPIIDPAFKRHLLSVDDLSQ